MIVEDKSEIAVRSRPSSTTPSLSARRCSGCGLGPVVRDRGRLSNFIVQLGFVGSAQYPLWTLTALALTAIVLYALIVRWEDRETA